MHFIIYKLTNQVTRQIYFGYTRQTLKQRLAGHAAEPRNTRISRSIRKYGIERFQVDIILECHDELLAKNTEVQLIANHQTNVIQYPDGNGLNMTDGGEGATGYKHSDALRQKWKLERKGQFAGRNHPNFGVPPEQSPKRKTVYQFTVNGELIATHPSTKNAAQMVGADASNISKCCNGKNKTIKGYIFSYTPNLTKRDVTNQAWTKIKQYTLTGELVDTYSSIAEAVRKLSLVDRSGIDKCLMGTITSSRGYIWKRA